MTDAEMIEWLDTHGCSNHGCDVRHTPRRVGTNAICQCVRRIAQDGDTCAIQRLVQFKAILAQAAIAEAVKQEREACAKLAADTVCDVHLPTGVKIYGHVAARAIRAREGKS